MATLTEKKASLQGLYRELEAGQKKISEGSITQPEGEALESKAKEAEQLQKEVEELEALGARFKPFAAKAREIENPALPRRNGAEPPPALESKAEFHKLGPDGSPIVAYATPGEAFTASDEFKSYMMAGAPLTRGSDPVRIEGLGEMVPITLKMTERPEVKAIMTVGAGVIRADRLPDVVRTTERPRVRMRDVLNVSQTNSNSVDWVTLSSWTDAAAPVAENAAKPESTATTGTGTAPVRTLAVWMPVTEQQLDDVPQIQNLINNELVADLRNLEEKQFLYGSGAGENLAGILPLAGVPLITRTVTNTQLLDRVRIGITDVLLAGGDPNAAVFHPLDWEAAVLLKATDNNYLWTVITDPQTGNSRVWGLTVVETTGAKNPANLQRYMLVGDFRRGATVFDRRQAAVQVGYINDDFTKNRRTIRAEERLAFAVRRPTFFAKFETATAV